MKKVYTIPADPEAPTRKVCEVLKAIDTDDDVLIKFEKGTYVFSREGLEKHRIFSSSTKSGENYVLFPIKNKSNVTIDGCGSEFVFCDRLQPFLFENCCNVALKNFSLDYSFLRYAYGTVVSTAENGFEMAIDKTKFHYSVDGGFLNFVCGRDTLSTKHRKISMKRLFPSKSGVYFLYAGDTVAAKNPAAKSVDVDAAETEQGVFFAYRENTNHPLFNVGDVICLAYDNDREAQAFYFDNSKNIRVENLSVYRNGGMCFVADSCENITIDGFRLALKEGRSEYYSSTADGVFLTQCCGKIVIKNSVIKDTYDDAINVHGFYTYVSEAVSRNQVKIVYRHDSHYGLIPCFKGDCLLVSEPDTFRQIGQVTIKEISCDEDRKNMCITYEGDIELREGMLLENANRMPDMVIENSVFKNCPHIRLSPKNAVVRNNTFESIHILIHDLIDFWGESGAVESAIFHNNTFDNAGIETNSCRPSFANRIHGTIRIEGNEFRESREKSVKISAVRELIEQNNTFAEGCYRDDKD
ncbi:MAG: hypothetical protein IJP27_00035 [Clostridia bacterium]|nr:hypothetical protein [Clostridia bacterium]